MAEKYRLQDICQIINGRAYKQEELLSEGRYPVLRVGNFFSSDRWYYSDLELSDDKYCEKGDLLYAWSASFGPRIWNGEKSIYHYHIWKIVPNEALVDKYYLYYWLKNSAEQITAGTHGSVMAHITKSDMEKQIIVLPPIDLQKKIGEVLQMYEGQVETNNQINELLLKQAMAFFQKENSEYQL